MKTTQNQNKKQPEQEFEIAKKRPKVLLLGNGLCRAYGGMSWNGLLDAIKDTDLYPVDAKNYLMPMPLKAAMLTNNKLATKLRGIVKGEREKNSQLTQYDWSSFTHTTDTMRERLNALIGNRFDYVLTTNYGYEIEAAIISRNEKKQNEALTVNKIANMMKYHEIDHAQRQFLINTYNDVNGIPVWHIHGEARKPDSMIVGNYYYGKLLRRCVERLDGFSDSEDVDKRKEPDGRNTGEKSKRKYSGSTRTNAFKHNKVIKIGSWIDAFVLGDVYILGFGLDLSESDIWWLLEYKANHPDICGQTFFYDPGKDNMRVCVNNETIPCDKRSVFIDANQCKKYLLENTYNVKTEDLDIIANNGEDYRNFYEKAIKQITSEVDSRR